MPDTGIKEQVLTEIKDLAKEYRIQKVILFGSRARGDYHTTSDIDLDGPVQEELRRSIEKEGIVIYEKI